MRTTRRTTLALLAAAAMQGRAKAASGTSVIVIGAGLAGLSAARALTAAGAKVTIVEARERIGGRIWTSTLWPNMPMDLGASWIHGVTGNPLTKLADAAGAKRLSTSYDSGILLNEEGREAEIGDEMDDAEDLVAKARKAAERKDRDEPLRRAVEDSPRWQKASARQRRIVRHYINSAIEQEYGGDWSEASAWSIDDSTDFGGGDMLFPGGFGQIVTHMAKGLEVRLGQAVSRIDATTDGVAVHTSGGVIAGDHAVVTVPIGVLQSGAIRFGDPLAAARQKAIDSLRMGLLNKCWLRFPRVAWPDGVDWIEWLGPRDGYWAEWVSLARGAKLPVLLGFHAGSQARAMEKLDDRAMAAAAREALKAMFGSDFPAPEAAQVTRWSRDPFALGSYSFHAVGTSPATRKALAGADWDGRLIFAGEATSSGYYGTAHGAVMSGEDAAKLV